MNGVLDILEDIYIFIYMNKSNCEQCADLLKTIAHPVRLQLLCLLSKSNCGNVTTLYGALKVHQAVVSYHLALMRNKKIIKAERKGRQVMYSVQDPIVASIMKTLTSQLQ
jgi:DNA-binding transcriptional ArsR family regulator